MIKEMSFFLTKLEIYIKISSKTHEIVRNLG